MWRVGLITRKSYHRCGCNSSGGFGFSEGTSDLFSGEVDVRHVMVTTENTVLRIVVEITKFTNIWDLYGVIILGNWERGRTGGRPLDQGPRGIGPRDEREEGQGEAYDS